MKRSEVKANGFKVGDRLFYGWETPKDEYGFSLYGTTLAAFVERNDYIYAIARAEFEEQVIGDLMLESDVEFFATLGEALNFAKENNLSIGINKSCFGIGED